MSAKKNKNTYEATVFSSKKDARRMAKYIKYCLHQGSIEIGKTSEKENKKLIAGKLFEVIAESFMEEDKNYKKWLAKNKDKINYNEMKDYFSLID